MAVGADLAVDVEVVQKNEVAGEGVVIRRDRFRKEAKVRLAVPFPDIAEDLVVGAVLLNDLHDVADPRPVAEPEGDRVTGRRRRSVNGGGVARPQGAALVDSLRIRGHLPGGWHGDERQSPLKESADVLLDPVPAAGKPRVWAVAIGA